MDVKTVTTSGENTLLSALKEALRDVDEALFCVAGVNRQGLHLIDDELEDLAEAARLLVSSRSVSAEAALALADQWGVRTGVASGSLHAKMFLTRRGDTGTAIIGSGNLTGKLVTNAEVAVVLHGKMRSAAIRDAWRLGQMYWNDREIVEWER